MGGEIRALIASLVFAWGCGGELPPQLVRGQVDEGARALIDSVAAMGLDGLRARTQLDANGRFLLALPVDESDSYQLQLVGPEASMIVPLAGQSGRLKVCAAEKETDLGQLHLVRGCEGTCAELEFGLAQCEAENRTNCESAELNWQVCQERAPESCMANTPEADLCAQELCANDELDFYRACIEVCAPLSDALSRCMTAAQQSCVFPIVALSDLGLPTSFGCRTSDGVMGM